MALYRANLRLSQEIFSVLAVFEVTLRNRIDQHYQTIFRSFTDSNEWLVHAANPGGYLTAHGCQKSLMSVQDALQVLRSRSNYTHDKLVAELTFGFWRFQFASKEFMAAGSSLHHIFPNRPPGTNHSDIFKKLGFVNKVRNRIAHHEPICFNPAHMISTAYALNHYHAILDLFHWMNVEAVDLLYGVDKVKREIAYIDGMTVLVSAANEVAVPS